MPSVARDRANLQLANRRLERKVKEMMMQVDDEHHSLQDQKDQVSAEVAMEILQEQTHRRWPSPPPKLTFLTEGFLIGWLAPEPEYQLLT